MKIKEFICLFLGVFLTRLGDVIGTYHYTPNLAAEANPMVSLFGLGWVYLLCAQIGAIIFSTILNYQSLFIIQPFTIKVSNLKLEEYLSTLYFNRISKWKWSYAFTKRPFGKKQTLYMYGWTIPRILILVGLIIITFHLMLAYIPRYKEIHKFFVIPMYLLILSCIPLVQFHYLYSRYRNYKSLN